MRATARTVTGKVLLVSAAVSVALFVIAAPFGQDHHGIGLVMSDIFWPLFLRQRGDLHPPGAHRGSPTGHGPTNSTPTDLTSGRRPLLLDSRQILTACSRGVPAPARATLVVARTPPGDGLSSGGVGGSAALTTKEALRGSLVTPHLRCGRSTYPSRT